MIMDAAMLSVWTPTQLRLSREADWGPGDSAGLRGVPPKGGVLMLPGRVYAVGLKLGKVPKRQAARERQRLQRHHERRGDPRRS